jgi:hypothetical protein
MPLDLAEYEVRTSAAVRKFWESRSAARERQEISGEVDRGERSGVTSGKNMDGFVDLVCETMRRNGLVHAEYHVRRQLVTLPGYFRPTKLWDLLVMQDSELVAAIEFKSQAGPSFGNNFNNRAEEAIGTASDFWTAHREGAFGPQSRPLLGWLVLVEDCPASRKPVREVSPHFPVDTAFSRASYLDRYEILARRLVLERLYGAAVVLASSRQAARTGAYCELSPETGMRQFVAALAACAAEVSARSGAR